MCILYSEFTESFFFFRPGPLSVMMSLGNEVGNSVWEAHARGQTKPNPRSSREDKERWIRAKYEAKEFVGLPQSGIPLNEQVRIFSFILQSIECTAMIQYME